MTTEYLHGVEVIEQSQKPTIDSINASVIGVVGSIKTKLDDNKGVVGSIKTKLDDNKADENQLYKVNSLEEFDKQFPKEQYEETGIREILADIYSQTNAQVVFSIIKKSKDDKNTISLDDFKSAFARLQKSNAQLKLVPKIIIAPEAEHCPEINSSNIKDFLDIVDKLKAILIWDVIDENSDELIKNIEDKLIVHTRLYPVYPKVKIRGKKSDDLSYSPQMMMQSNNNNEKNLVERPASSFVAGLIVRSDKERGFWHSPSNYSFNNIEGLSENIDFSLGDTNCHANRLNEIKVNTIIWQDGYRLWGNRSYSNVNNGFSFISARRVADVLDESITKAHLWAIDQNITKNFKETIVDSVNTYIRKLKMQGAIIDGKCYADKNQNTPENLAEGRFYFCFDFTPPYPAERITFQSILTNDYLNEVL